MSALLEPEGFAKAPAAASTPAPTPSPAPAPATALTSIQLQYQHLYQLQLLEVQGRGGEEQGETEGAPWPEGCCCLGYRGREAGQRQGAGGLTLTWRVTM